jgi:hypothetical protein
VSNTMVEVPLALVGGRRWSIEARLFAMETIVYEELDQKRLEKLPKAVQLEVIEIIDLFKRGGL